MWSQSWGNIEKFVRPAPNATGVDVTDEMVRQVSTPAGGYADGHCLSIRKIHWYKEE